MVVFPFAREAASNRRGGPHAGYRNPYEQQVMAGFKKDYEGGRQTNMRMNYILNYNPRN